ncbi:Thioredoxin [uncultured archaeon]|nr:Thioredoxin [uncultured archaeon]
MVVCIIALFVFGILSIFSATHRPLFKEALDCVFRKATLRPCNTGLDRRLKMLVSVKVMKRNEGLGKFINKHFESISTLFTLIFIGSIAFTGIGLYNFWAYGNCNGPNTNAFCPLSPETYSGTNPLEWLFPPSPGQVKMVPFEGLPMKGNADAQVKIIEVGCFTCPYTKSTEYLVQEVLDNYNGADGKGGKVALYFKYFPLPTHNYSFKAAEAAECARDQGKFWEYKDLLFKRQLECTQTPDESQLLQHYKGFAADLNLDTTSFNACLDSGKYTQHVQQQKQESINAGIYGTPTFFINGKVLVAPKTIEEFSAVIDAELAKAK